MGDFSSAANSNLENESHQVRGLIKGREDEYCVN